MNEINEMIACKTAIKECIQIGFIAKYSLNLNADCDNTSTGGPSGSSERSAAASATPYSSESSSKFY